MVRESNTKKRTESLSPAVAFFFSQNVTSSPPKDDEKTQSKVTDLGTPIKKPASKNPTAEPASRKKRRDRQTPNARKKQYDGKIKSFCGQKSGTKTAKDKMCSESISTTTCHSDSNSSTTTASSSSRRHPGERQPHIATFCEPASASSGVRPLHQSSRRNRTSNSFSNNFQKVHSHSNSSYNNNYRSSSRKSDKNCDEFFAGVAAAPAPTALPSPPQAWITAAKLKHEKMLQEVQNTQINLLEPAVGLFFQNWKAGGPLVSSRA